MGKITGFLEFEREDRDYEPVEQRVKHWREFVLPLPEEENKKQAARCMDCGIPYCHGTNIVTGAPTGCPVNNQIPDWNDLVYRGNWQEAARNLHSTNNFPEVTGRVCPAPCEASCTLNIDDNPVTIKTIECAIADRAYEQGWVKPEPPSVKTGKKVAIVGSGPAGMACARSRTPGGNCHHGRKSAGQPNAKLLEPDDDSGTQVPLTRVLRVANDVAAEPWIAPIAVCIALDVGGDPLHGGTKTETGARKHLHAGGERRGKLR